MAEVEKIIGNGDRPNEEIIFDIDNEVNKLNDPDTEKNWVNLKESIKVMDQAELMSRVNLKRELENFKDQDVDLTQSNLLERLENILKNKEQALNDDPLAHYNDIGKTITPLTMDGHSFEDIITSRDEDLLAEWKKQVSLRRYNSHEIAKNENISLRFFNNDQRSMLINLLESSDTSTDLVIMRNLADVFGPDYNKVLEEIYYNDSKEAKKWASIGFNVLANEKTAFGILEGANVEDTSIFKESSKSDYQEQARLYINEIPNLPTSFVDQVMQNAINLWKFENRHEEIPDDNIELYVNRVVGLNHKGEDAYGGIVLLDNDQSLLIPYDVNQSKAINVIANQMTRPLITLASNKQTPHYQDQHGKIVPYSDNDIKNLEIFLVMQSEGDYFLSISDPGQGGGNYIVNKDGDPLVFDMRKALEIHDSSMEDMMNQMKLDERKENVKLLKDITMTEDNYSSLRGREVTESAIDFVVSIMPGTDALATKQLMMGIANTESEYATHPDTFRTKMSTGPFQFDEGDETVFSTIMNRIKEEPGGRLASNALKIQEAVNNMDAINGKPNFDILNLTWQDMNNPLYSAILLRLFMALDPNEIPSTLKGQAEWWKSKWNTKEGKGSVSDFIEKNENDKLWK